MAEQEDGEATLEEDIDKTIAYIDSFQIGSPGGKPWEGSDAGFHDPDEDSIYPDIEDDDENITPVNEDISLPGIEEQNRFAASWAASVSGPEMGVASSNKDEYKAWQKANVGGDRNTEGDFCQPSRDGPPNPWTTPLAEPPKTIKFQEAEISHVEYPFLTAFLCKKRSVDFPFPVQKDLITFVLYTIQDACYEFARQNFPDQLKYARIQCFDQIEILEWTAFIEGLRCQFPDKTKSRFQPGRWPTPQIGDIGCISLGEVRNAAYHRLPYDTHCIIHAVFLLRQLNSQSQLRDVEWVLKMLYLDKCRQEDIKPTIEPLSTADTRTADKLLDVNSYPCKTQQSMLLRIQEVLEYSLFHLVQARNPATLADYGISYAGQVELHYWYTVPEYKELLSDSLDPTEKGFLASLPDIVTFRNAASHPGKHPLPELEALIDSAITLLKHIRDSPAIGEIERLVVCTRSYVDATTKERLESYPSDAAGLKRMYKEAHNAGLRFFNSIWQVRQRLTEHEMRVHHLFMDTAAYFLGRYERVKNGVKEDDGEESEREVWGGGDRWSRGSDEMGSERAGEEGLEELTIRRAKVDVPKCLQISTAM